MSAWKIDVSYPAGAQMERLPKADRLALKRLFSIEDINDMPTTRRTSDGRFVSGVGNKRVLWRQRSPKEVEILSIVDGSFSEAK